MPSINFQKQFAPGVRAMISEEYAKRNRIRPKTTTIRAMRKRPFKKGDMLYLFTGLRTAHCERLGKVICHRVEGVEIFRSEQQGQIRIGEKLLNRREIQRLATNDGFKCAADLFRWFEKTHGLPFAGQRIHMTSSYERKYYLHRKARQMEVRLKITRCEKTIEISQETLNRSGENKYVRELREKHGYGVQVGMEMEGATT